MSWTAFALLIAISGQEPEHRVRGRVVDAEGAPVAGANVFIIETLAGVLTGSDGGFELRIKGSAATVAVQMIGYHPHRQRVVVPRTASLIIELQPAAVAIDPLSVRAGGYEISDQRGASLSSLEVVQIPGSRGDVMRAFQTLPGVQSVDEGSGLFVRGGAASETRIVLNGAAILAPQRLETPTGSVAPSVDPFLLQGMFFSTGGFSVRHGNALSAVADLQTIGMPARARNTAHVSLASVSGRTSRPVSTNAGMHVTGNLSNTHLMFELNGSTREYTNPPHGHTMSASGVWQYRPSAEIKAFAIRQVSELGVMVEDAALRDAYRSASHTHIGVLSWRDWFGKTNASASLSFSNAQRNEQLGALNIDVEQQAAQLFLEVRRQFGGVSARVGGDLEDVDADYHGAIPLQRFNRGSGAAVRNVDHMSTGTRHGVFAELDVPLTSKLRVTPGIRTDHSTLTTQRTFDPRISVSAALGNTTSVVAAAGWYHQVPDALMLAALNYSVPAMHTRQLVLGVQSGSDSKLLRVEAYHKRYQDLVQFDRNRNVAVGGTGHARGVDVFKRATLPGHIDTRLVYSFVDAERTDPNTDQIARAEFDVTHSFFVMLQREWGERWRTGVSYRGATGRPFTSIGGASYDETQQRWIPNYAEPYADRLPHFHRVDVSGSYLHWFNNSTLAVVYVSLSNILNRENVYDIRYSDDYSQSFMVPAQTRRSVFFGVSLSF